MLAAIIPLAVFASPPTVTGRWSTDGSTWRNFNDAQAPHLGFSGFGALGEDGQQLQLKVEVGFSSSPGQKKVEVTIADSLEWIDNGASNIPEPIFASVSGPFDRTVWQENVSTQHTFNDGRYVYTFKPDTVSATLNFRVANNTADDYSYQDNPIIVDVSEDSASSQLVLPRINYMTLGYQLAPQSYSRTRTVPLDTDVGMVDSIATVYDHLYTGSDFRRKRLFENMKITLEAPEGAEVQGVYDDNLEIREHMTNGGWTYTNVGTTNYITTWEFTLDKRRASYFGLSPIWRFPSSSFNLGGTATITYKQVEWNYYGGSKYTRVYSNAAGDGVGTRTDRYTFSNTENVLPLAGTYVKANFISPDHPGAHGDLGSYGIANEGGADSTPKWVELEFDTTKVGVTALHLIGEPGTRNIEIQYRKEGEAGWPNTTTLSKTFPDSPQTLSRSLLYGTELGLAKAEYIAALRYKVEHTPGGGGPAYGVKAGHAISSSTNVFYGIAKPGCSSPISTTVNVRDVADANDVQTTTVNTSTSTPNVMSAIVPTLLGDRVVEAGEDIVFSATIKNYNHEQTYLSKAPIIYIRDETGVGISDVSLVSSRGVNLFTAYPDKVIWDHHHTELNGTKVYKIDTSGLNNTSLSYEAQYAAATGYHTYERESRSLQLSWKVSTPSNYNDAIKRHFNHDILWVTDTYSDVMNGAGRRGDPHEVHSTSQFNQLVVGITEGTAYYQVQNRANLDMVTEAKSTQDGSVWKTWNGSTDDLIPTSSTNNYQVRTSVGSDSGQPSSNQSYVYIPIPKKNQEWGVLNEGYSDIPYDTTTYKSTFGFDTFLAGPVSNPDSSRYTITYGTIPTGSFNASTGFGDVGDALKAHSSWNNNYDNTTNMVRIRVSGVSANMPHSFTMELSSNVSTNTENSVNIYRPLYWQDLTNAQADVFTTWAQGDPIAFRLLSIGSLQGQVFFDGNTNSVWDSGEAIPSGTHNFSGWTLGVYEPQGTTPVAEHNLTNDGGYAISGLSRAIAYNLRLTSPQGEPYYVGPSNRTYSTTQQTVGTYNFFALNTGSNTQATAEGVYAVDIPGQQGAEEQGNGIYNIGLTGSTTWTIYTHEDLSSFTNSKDSPSTTYAGNTMNIVTGGPHDTVGNLTVTPQTNYQFVGWMAYNGSASDFATLNNTQKLALSVPSITPSASDLFPTPTDTTTLNYEDRMLYGVHRALTTITATKQWDDNGSGASHPTSVSVQLRQNGTNYGNPVTLNNTNSWTTTWQDLPLNDNTGNPYTYTVTEPTVPPGYTLSTTGTGTTSDPFILTNTRDITSVWVTKKWINPLDETTPSEVKLILLRGIEGSGAPVSYRTHILTGTAGTDWYYTFTNLPEKDLLGNSYIYTIEEEVPTKYTLKITGTGKATDPFILTNSRTMPDPVEVTINGKVILQGKELEADQFTVVLTLPDRLTTLSTKNKADGSFTFPTQTHPLPGNYTYTIHQVQGSAEGITYSGTQYSANLKVTLDSEGNKLNYKLTSTKDGKLMEDGEIFVFINSYSEPAFTPTLTVLPKTGK